MSEGMHPLKESIDPASVRDLKVRLLQLTSRLKELQTSSREDGQRGALRFDVIAQKSRDLLMELRNL